MINTYRIDDASVQVAVDGREDDVLSAILRIEEAVSECAAPSSGGASGGLFCVEGVVEAIAERAAEPN